MSCPHFGVKNALGPFLKFLLRQHKHRRTIRVKSDKTEAWNLWATFLHFALKLYNCHKNTVWRQIHVILDRESPCHAAHEIVPKASWDIVPRECWSSFSGLIKTARSELELSLSNKDLPKREILLLSVILRLFLFSMDFSSSSRVLSFQTKFWHFRPHLRFLLDCLNTLKILLVG